LAKTPYCYWYCLLLLIVASLVAFHKFTVFAAVRTSSIGKRYEEVYYKKYPHNCINYILVHLKILSLKVTTSNSYFEMFPDLFFSEKYSAAVEHIYGYRYVLMVLDVVPKELIGVVHMNAVNK